MKLTEQKETADSLILSTASLLAGALRWG